YGGFGLDRESVEDLGGKDRRNDKARGRDRDAHSRDVPAWAAGSAFGAGRQCQRCGGGIHSSDEEHGKAQEFGHCDAPALARSEPGARMSRTRRRPDMVCCWSSIRVTPFRYQAPVSKSGPIGRWAGGPAGDLTCRAERMPAAHAARAAIFGLRSAKRGSTLAILQRESSASDQVPMPAPRDSGPRKVFESQELVRPD